MDSPRAPAEPGAVWSWRPSTTTDAWRAHTADVSAQLESAHTFRQHHRRRTGCVEVNTGNGRYSADIFTMTMTEVERARVGGDLFASRNSNAALRFDLRRESAAEWTLRTGEPPPAAGAAAAADDSEDDSDDDIQPGQLMKALALEIDKRPPARRPNVAAPPSLPQPAAEPDAQPAPQPGDAEPESESESESESSDDSDSTDSEDELSLTELRQVKDNKEAAALESARALAKLAPPLSLPAAGSVNTALSPEQAEMLDFALSTLRPRTKPAVSPGILVGAHCEASVRALSLQLVAGASCRKVLWVSKSPSALASALRTTFEPVGGFTTHSFNSAPRSEGVGIALHGGAICLSYAQLVAMHKATHTPASASDSTETVTSPTSSPLDRGPF